MSDVLEPNEVDALLAAVQSGKLAVAPARGSEPRSVVPYDFTHPERVNKDQLRALTTLHESFARSLAASLSALMGAVVEVTVSSVQQVSYSDFISGLANPTSLALVSAPPLPGSFLLETSPSITFPIIDRMLGGSQGEVSIPTRPLTDIEARLFKRLVVQVLPLLEQTWSSVQKLTLSVDDIATNPQMVHLTGPHEPLVLVTIDVTLGPNSGAMLVAMPYSTLEPVMKHFSAQGWLPAAPKTSEGSNVAQISRSLSGATVELVANLSDTSITVRELLDLQVGDVIKTDLPVDGEITLCVDGKPKFKGHPGRARRNKAVQVSRRIESDPQE